MFSSLENKINSRILLYRKKLFDNFSRKILNHFVQKEFTPQGYRCLIDLEEIQEFESPFIKYFEDLEQEANLCPFGHQAYQRYLSERSAIRYYCGYISKEINDFLRGGETGELFHHDKLMLLQSIINGFETTYPIIAIRRQPRFVLSQNRKGDIYIERGFLSSTIKINSRFVYDHGDPLLNNETLLILKIPNGTKALYPSVHGKRDEFELIIQKGAKLLIERNYSFLGNSIVVAKVLNND